MIAGLCLCAPEQPHSLARFCPTACCFLQDVPLPAEVSVSGMSAVIRHKRAEVRKNSAKDKQQKKACVNLQASLNHSNAPLLKPGKQAGNRNVSILGLDPSEKLLQCRKHSLGSVQGLISD